MGANIESCAAEEAGCGLFSGIGGWAVVLHELAEAGDPDAAPLVQRVLSTVAAGATVTGDDEVNWHDYTEMIWGTAGVGCVLLALGPRYLGRDPAVDLAVRAGNWLLTHAEPAPGGGSRWRMGEAWRVRYPDRDPLFPNFAHGTAGIAFFLSQLAAATGASRYLDAALAGADWILGSTVRVDRERDTCMAFHHEPDGTAEYTLGWCHGPPGLGSLFRSLELTTGSAHWRSWLRRAARADLLSGIPERREPGFWDNVARCCGSAGVAEFFLDLHVLENRDEDLAFARVLVDDLLDRAIVDGAGMRWSNYEYRAAEPDLPPETTYLQGAAGIGSTLLRLHRQLSGDPWAVNWPHLPDWRDPG